MVLEVAILGVKPGQTQEFESAFSEAHTIISSMRGPFSDAQVILRGNKQGHLASHNPIMLKDQT